MGIRGSTRAAALALAALLLAGGGLPSARADITGVVFNAANGHYYKWVAGTTTWNAAKAGATALGGYLVTVTSTAEQTWLPLNVIPSGQTSCLGATDETTEGTWLWITGETWSYMNWNGGEPNNSGNEDYLAWNTNGTWNDIVGTSGGTSGYVVEWDENPNVPPPPADPTVLAGVLGPADHVLLSWNDNSTNEASFQLERKTSAGSYSTLATLVPNTVSYDDGATVPSSSYVYRLRAVNAGGVSNWTNEVTVDIPATPTGPLAPSAVGAIASNPSSITVGWTDNSADEDSFEVQRRNPGGSFQIVATLFANAVQYASTGLAPDVSYDFRVRAVNANGASAFAEATLSTPPTLAVTTVKADLKDSAKPAKDSLKIQARFEFLPASDGDFDPVTEGITVRAGSDAGPVSLTLPPGLPDWKVTTKKATWKSAKGSLPKYKVEVSFADRLVKVTVTGLTLASAPTNPMRVTVGIGDDAGTEHLDWVLKKAGFFQFR